jgi:hypothetical protein
MARTLTFLLAALAAQALSAAEPIKLHPENPHYFEFRGKPTVLITSGEHYGAVLNGAFDYVKYLDTLQADGMNLTRTFSGTYRENPGSFNIEENTLAPDGKDFVCPWARSDQPGCADGGNKFDLDRWNDAYFARLKNFVAKGGEREVVVELVLFCVLYDDGLHRISPMNAANNIQGIGNQKREDFLAMKEPALHEAQMKFVNKVVRELRDFDNVYFELCNEPYFNNVTREWNEAVCKEIAAAEADLPVKHLIAQNIANDAAVVKDPIEAVSILNFHYAHPPITIAQNYALNRPIADDETGFDGTGDDFYRREAWDFMVAGGAVFSNLDYSFSVSHPDGTKTFTKSPGGGSRQLRFQLKKLHEFLDGFDFVHMKPSPEVVRSPLPEGVTAQVLANPGEAYAVYIKGGQEVGLKLALPAGEYTATWIEPRDGNAMREDAITSSGEWEVQSPQYKEELALKIIAK